MTDRLELVKAHLGPALVDWLNRGGVSLVTGLDGKNGQIVSEPVLAGTGKMWMLGTLRQFVEETVP